MLLPPADGRRRVVLHIGQHKTGSTALQVAFSRARERLLEDGVWYPQDRVSDARAAKSKVISGNGNNLWYFVMDPDSKQVERLKPVEHVLSEVKRSTAPTVLFSSENLWRVNVSKDPLTVLRDRLADLGVHLQVAAYVRDVSGYACSYYSQLVKRDFWTAPFSEYVRTIRQKPQFVGTVRHNLSYLVRVLGRENIEVLHYDTHRKALLDSFLAEVLGINDASSYPEAPRGINRILTPAETEMMRYVNSRSANNRDTTALSDALLELPPFGDAQQRISRADLSVLHENFDHQVKWVNDVFFSESRLWNVESDEVEIVDSGSEYGMREETQAVLDWLISIGPRMRS